MKKLYALIVIIGLSISLMSCGEVLLQTNLPGNDSTLNVQLLGEGQTSTQEILPIFTLDELAQYTGANGSTAYIAVNGVVYDVTNVFTDGKHQGIQLGGTDATNVFAASPHTADLISTLTIVGYLEGSQAATDYLNSQPGTTTTTTTTTTNNTTSTTGTTTTTQQTTNSNIAYLPVFTLTDLAQYTGANGSTAYTAVNGVVYDVTNVFTNGMHQGIQIGGIDATNVFASSPHSDQILASLPVVGSLEGYPMIASQTTNSGDTPVTTTNPGTYDDDDDEYEHEDSDHHSGTYYDDDEYEYDD